MGNGKLISSWREDLDHARDVSKRDAETLGFVVNWFESWRLAKDLDATRDVAARFWREAVMIKERVSWQLDQWAEGIRWYLNWIELCKKEDNYVSWYKDYVEFHDLKHPTDLGKSGVEDFLNYGECRVYVPEALDRKLGGRLSRSLEWFWVFPTALRGVDPRDGEEKRHYMLEGAVSKWLKIAVLRLG